MNSKGNTRKAFKQFSKDYTESEELKIFRKNAKIISFEDVKTKEFINNTDRSIKDEISVVGVKKVNIHFGIPESDTKESRILNDKLRKKGIL